MDEHVETGTPITWHAPEYEPRVRTREWFLTLWIIATAATVAAFILKNFTFGIFIILASGVLTLLAKRPPRMLEASIDNEVMRFGSNRYYLDRIDGFSVEATGDDHGRILIKLKHSFMPLITIPIENIKPEIIDATLAKHVPRKKLEESLLEKLIHYFGI